MLPYKWGLCFFLLFCFTFKHINRIPRKLSHVLLQDHISWAMRHSLNSKINNIAIYMFFSFGFYGVEIICPFSTKCVPVMSIFLCLYVLTLLGLFRVGASSVLSAVFLSPNFCLFQDHNVPQLTLPSISPPPGTI